MVNYTDQTPMLGTGVVSAAAIQAWFDSVNHNAPQSLGTDIVTCSTTWGLNADLVAAQIAHETDYWRSAIANQKNNPAGIGAENDDPFNKAIAFATPFDGIRAQCAHLMSYISGDGPWRGYDPRYAALVVAHWLDTVTVLKDLNGKWAWPGTTYGAQIAARANALVAFAGTLEPPMVGDDSRFQWIPDTSEYGYPQGTRGRNGHAIDLGITHITVGTDSLAWLNGNNGSSAHYLTDRLMKPRAQMVREADAAWTPGSRAYALRSINIEAEKMDPASWTHAQITEYARTSGPIWQRNNIPFVYLGHDSGPGKRGLIGHSDVPNPNPPGSPNYCGPYGGSSCHTDPGASFDWNFYIAELKRLYPDGGGSPEPGPPADDRILVEGNGHGDYGYRLGFRQRLEQIGKAISPNDVNAGILTIAGYATEDEWQGVDGNAYQQTERVTLVYTPNTAGPWDIVFALKGQVLPARKADG